jgi:hypothetical protein
MSRSTAAHRAQVAGTRSLVSPGTFLRVLLTLVVAITLALIATNGTYAYLSSSAPVKLLPGSDATKVSITAGTSGLALGTPGVDLAAFYPGLTRSGDMTVTASGTVGLALSVTSITGTSSTGFGVTIAPGLCSANGTAVTTGSLGVTVAPGASASLCVRVALATSSPASAINTGTALAVVITGAQA